MSKILTVLRGPLDLAPLSVRRQSRQMTLLEMARAMDLPREWWTQGIIAVDRQVVPRDLWSVSRPRSTANEVRFLIRLAGGGDRDGGKNPMALLGSLALLAVTGGIAGGALAPVFGTKIFAAGTLVSRGVAGLVGALGSAAIQGAQGRPSAPQRQGGNDLDASRVSTASMAGNVLSPDAPIDRVLGTRKIFPPMACEPFTYYDGDDEIVEGAFVLAGPHALSDIRLGDATVDDMAGVEVQTREGFPGQEPIDLVTRQTRTEGLGHDLSVHRLLDDGLSIDDSLDTNWAPQPTVLATRDGPDEFWLACAFSQGLNIEGATSAPLRVPLRMRVRRLGTETWRVLPELHFVGAALRPIRFTIKLKWGVMPEGQMTAPTNEGFVEARIAAPTQTDAPAGVAFAADAAFSAGSGDDYLTAASLATTGVENVSLGEREALIWLDPAEFPTDLYEVEVTRGAAVTSSDYATAAYTVSGDVWDLFGAKGTVTLQVVQDQKKRVSALSLVRASSIWNEHPIATDECAVIALRARNVATGQLSVVASGYVQGIEAGDLGDWITTSNPAPHFRDVLVGQLNAKPVPVGSIDDEALVEWAADCRAKGYEINGIINGETVEGVLSRLAAVGFASPRRSNVWGVVRAVDTSGDAPEFVFTPRNSRGFQVNVEFPDRPAGIRASFADASRNYVQREIRYPDTAPDTELEARTYDDLTSEADVLRRVKFELSEMTMRAATYTLTAAAEAIPMKRGQLVGVARDVLDNQMGSGRVIDWAENEFGELVSLQLDAEVPLSIEPDVRSVSDFRAVPDVRALGRNSFVAIRGDDGTAPVLTTHALSGSTGDTDTLTLATPAADTGVGEGALVAVGAASQVFRRMIVADITRASEFIAEVTLVAEAAELTADH